MEGDAPLSTRLRWKVYFAEITMSGHPNFCGAEPNSEVGLQVAEAGVAPAEVLLSTQVINDESGTPRVEATYFW